MRTCFTLVGLPHLSPLCLSETTNLLAKKPCLLANILVHSPIDQLFYQWVAFTNAFDSLEPKKTYARISELYRGPTLELCKFVIRRCKHCNITAPQSNTGYVNPIISRGPMDRLVIDLMDFSVSLVSSLAVILYTNYTQKSTPDGDYNYIL